MRISLKTLKSIAIILAVFFAATFGIAQASSPTSKKQAPAEEVLETEEDTSYSKQAKSEKAPEGEIYKPEALGDIDLKKYRENETKLSRPEKVKPAIEKPGITLPKAGF